MARIEAPQPPPPRENGMLFQGRPPLNRYIADPVVPNIHMELYLYKYKYIYWYSP